MTTNNPGSVNQLPLYVCTSCISRYEDCTWPAGDLRVHSGECWCYPCWDERRWDFPDQPSWNDLEPYTPARQAECEELRNLLRHAQPIIRAHAEASHMLEGFRPRRNQWDELVEGIDAAIQEEKRGR